MIVAPLSRNLAAGATVLTDDLAFYPGRGPANLYARELRKPARFRPLFRVVTGASGHVDANGGSFTLAAGLYTAAGLAAEWTSKALAFGLTAPYAFWRQDSSARYRFVVGDTAPFSLDTKTGAHALTSAMRILMGYAPEDVTAAEHTGAFACIHGPAVHLALDFGAAVALDGAFLAGLDSSPAAIAYVQRGATDPADQLLDCFGDADRDGMGVAFEDTTAKRYLLLTLADPRREDAAWTGLDAIWAGTWFDTMRAGLSDTVEYEADTFGHALSQRSVVKERKYGYPTIAEVAPGEVFSLAWGTAPGVEPSMVPGFDALFRDLRTTERAYLWLPGETPRLCRLAAMPVETPIHGSTRWSIATTWEAIS